MWCLGEGPVEVPSAPLDLRPGWHPRGERLRAKGETSYPSRDPRRPHPTPIASLSIRSPTVLSPRTDSDPQGYGRPRRGHRQDATPTGKFRQAPLPRPPERKGVPAAWGLSPKPRLLIKFSEKLISVFRETRRGGGGVGVGSEPHSLRSQSSETEINEKTPHHVRFQGNRVRLRLWISSFTPE